jgi:type I restriction enzyme R subunit
VKRLHRIDKEMAGDVRRVFAAFVPDGDTAKYARGLSVALRSNFVETMNTLRDEAFQALLVNYPRARPVFYVAPEVEDQVESHWLIRDRVGGRVQAVLDRPLIPGDRACS